jgi:tRNA-dihydrouridine synthase 3
MAYRGRNEMETKLASDQVQDWLDLSSMWLGNPAPSFHFHPKHSSNSYSTASADAVAAWQEEAE